MKFHFFVSCELILFIHRNAKSCPFGQDFVLEITKFLILKVVIILCKSECYTQ